LSFSFILFHNNHLHRPQDEPINRIECLSLDGAPEKPISLQKFEEEQNAIELEAFEVPF
jgi:hypothetical protein